MIDPAAAFCLFLAGCVLGAFVHLEPSLLDMLFERPCCRAHYATHLKEGEKP
jgi:hypothetical protein